MKTIFRIFFRKQSRLNLVETLLKVFRLNKKCICPKVINVIKKKLCNRCYRTFPSFISLLVYCTNSLMFHTKNFFQHLEILSNVLNFDLLNTQRVTCLPSISFNLCNEILIIFRLKSYLAIHFWRSFQLSWPLLVKFLQMRTVLDEEKRNVKRTSSTFDSARSERIRFSFKSESRQQITFSWYFTFQQLKWKLGYVKVT